MEALQAAKKKKLRDAKKKRASQLKALMGTGQDELKAKRERIRDAKRNHGKRSLVYICVAPTPPLLIYVRMQKQIIIMLGCSCSYYLPPLQAGPTLSRMDFEKWAGRVPCILPSAIRWCIQIHLKGVVILFCRGKGRASSREKKGRRSRSPAESASWLCCGDE